MMGFLRLSDLSLVPRPNRTVCGIDVRLGLRPRAAAALHVWRCTVAAVFAFTTACAPSPVEPPRFGGFATAEERAIACLDLQDKLVDLFALDYLSEHSVALSPPELKAFRYGWGQELARNGTFDRFDQACFASLTKAKAECAGKATTVDGVISCAKWGLE